VLGSLLLVSAALAASPWPAPAVSPAGTGISVQQDAEGQRLLVNGEPFFIRGMNWGYMPIGENYRYSLWARSDAFIEQVLHREMAMLRELGVNSIRQYDDIPPKWVTWIYENYGIYTMVNPLFGRYGIDVDGRWVPVVDYSNPTHRKVILDQTTASARRFANVPGVLMFMLGNENNYGLHWSSFEIEALPPEDQGKARAVHLYTLFGEGIDAIHAAAPGIPVSICNGDLQYLDLVAEHAGQMDLFGTNVYRGASARDLYERVEKSLGVPIFYSEFGADAFDARRMREDPVTQARYVRDQWEDIYENTHGQGVGNAIGGYQFQWSDGWWKHKQTENLDIHDPTASWPNAGYGEDFVEGRNNMNEEWFGITAKGRADARGHFYVYPRPAYYVLQDVWRLDPYAGSTDQATIDAHFMSIDPGQGLLTYRTSVDAAQANDRTKAFVRGVRLDLNGTTTEDSARTGQGKQRLDFDHGQSLYVDFGATPNETLDVRAEVNVLGNVAQNPIDPLTYASRAGKLIAVKDDPLTPEDESDADALALDQASERVRLYQAEGRWEHQLFSMHAYYRVGHHHWGDEGDFFGLYREAYYGENIDIYDAAVPIGVELEGKGSLDGLAIAGGPQVFWGANPAVFGRYGFDLGKSRITLVHQEDITQQGAAAENRAIPQLVTRKSTLHIERNLGDVHLDLGGIMAGTDRLGMSFVDPRPASTDPTYLDSGVHLYEDHIQWVDTLGTKAKLMWEPGPVHAYLQAAYRGLVADGGPDQTITYTGWTLKDGGQGNGTQLLTGVAIDIGSLQVAPNFLYQKPFVAPLPTIESTWNPTTGWYYAGTQARNTIDDPFAVLGNRETIAGELMFVWDPTPGTWFWAWDNPLHEDAPLAMALNLVYRHQPTSRDAHFGFSETGELFAFANAPPAADVWTAELTALSRVSGHHRVQVGAMYGREQSTGDDDRLIDRQAVTADWYWKTTALKTAVRWNDWGPYDYHRTFNLTFPFQSLIDLSTGVRGFALEDHGTRMGARFKYRTLDEHSNNVELLGNDGHQLELFSYLTFQM